MLYRLINRETGEIRESDNLAQLLNARDLEYKSVRDYWQRSRGLQCPTFTLETIGNVEPLPASGSLTRNMQLALFGYPLTVVASSGSAIALGVGLSQCCEESQTIHAFTRRISEWQRREIARNGASYVLTQDSSGQEIAQCSVAYCDYCEQVCEWCDNVTGPNRDYSQCSNCNACSECCECFYCDSCDNYRDESEISRCGSDNMHCNACCDCERCVYCERFGSSSQPLYLCEHDYCEHCRDYARCDDCEQEFLDSLEEEDETETYADDVAVTPSWTDYGLLRNGARFGVELEVSGLTIDRAVAVLQSVNIPVNAWHSQAGSWTVVSDCSVNNGCEVVSPILSGEHGFAMLQTVMVALRANGARVDSSCGTHVHHDAAGYDGKQLAAIARFYLASNDAIDSVMVPSRRVDGHAALDYCKRNDPRIIEQLDAAESATDLDRAVWNDTRYRVVNLCAYSKHGTVEFRQHAGTLNYRKLSAWIRFSQSLILAALDGASGCNSLGVLLLTLKRYGLEEEHAAYLLRRAEELAA